MAQTPLGISFIPTEANSANGPQQALAEGGGGSDLASAVKILSLHLPRVLGAQAMTSPRLLTSPGAAGVAGPVGAGAFNPYAAVFQALLQALSGGTPPAASNGGFEPDAISSLLGGRPSAGGGMRPPPLGGGGMEPRVPPLGGTSGPVPPPGSLDTPATGGTRPGLPPPHFTVDTDMTGQMRPSRGSQRY